MTLQTILRTYNFDVSEPAGKAAWLELKARLTAAWPRCYGPVLADCWSFVRSLDGQTVELETKHLFDNQWNTAPIAGLSDKGLRVFDWAWQSSCNPHSTLSAPRDIRRGHYLEQTPEMRELRRNTSVCGFCGQQEPAAKGYVFCPACIDSEYLKESELHLTRMLPFDATGDRAPLSEAESAHLLPLYREAQLHGSTARGKARIEKVRYNAVAKCAEAINNATVERDGMLWLMDHGFGQLAAQNTIFYPHTGRFAFGWRNKLSAEMEQTIASAAPPFPYDFAKAK